VADLVPAPQCRRAPLPVVKEWVRQCAADKRLGEGTWSLLADRAARDTGAAASLVEPWAGQAEESQTLGRLTTPETRQVHFARLTFLLLCDRHG